MLGSDAKLVITGATGILAQGASVRIARDIGCFRLREPRCQPVGRNAQYGGQLDYSGYREMIRAFI